MTNDEAIRILTAHLHDCGALMPIDWIKTHSDGSPFMAAYKMALGALESTGGGECACGFEGIGRHYHYCPNCGAPVDMGGCDDG